ncbi:hypothetical protein O181_006146 [Austropuccinia psidii MF-1]|uniref:Uncharacterized protein n=1 Tax=Austropuccinia psidii MF-1 TaxID=1389203 RepID=A0A9Q3BK99_9BASI|nr:hypothetical protein [Austropuccinia psidii MF-1]
MRALATGWGHMGPLEWPLLAPLNLSQKGPKWPKKAIWTPNPPIKGSGPEALDMAEGKKTPGPKRVILAWGFGEVVNWPRRPMEKDMAWGPYMKVGAMDGQERCFPTKPP